MNQNIAIVVLFFSVLFASCSEKSTPVTPISKLQKQEKATPRPTPSKEKNGILVVLDPGHGGPDPGCVFDEKGPRPVAEDEYAYDVCCRAKALLESQGYTVIFTITDKITGTEVREVGYLPVDYNEHLTANPRMRIRGQSNKCMDERIAAATNGIKKFNPSNTFWVSVHIDAQGSGDVLQGSHIVTPIRGPFTQSMTDAFARKSLLRKKNGIEYHPVGLNGDPRKLYVLRPDKNSVARRILIELGNIQNRIDRGKMLDPKARNIWAEAIVEGIVKA